LKNTGNRIIIGVFYYKKELWASKKESRRGKDPFLDERWFAKGGRRWKRKNSLKNRPSTKPQGKEPIGVGKVGTFVVHQSGGGTKNRGKGGPF